MLAANRQPILFGPRCLPKGSSPCLKSERMYVFHDKSQSCICCFVYQKIKEEEDSKHELPQRTVWDLRHDIYPDQKQVGRERIVMVFTVPLQIERIHPLLVSDGTNFANAARS